MRRRRLEVGTAVLLAAAVLTGGVLAFRASAFELAFVADWRQWDYLWNDEHGISVRVGPKDEGFFRIRAHRWQLGPVLIDVPLRDAALDDERWAVAHGLIPASAVAD